HGRRPIPGACAGPSRSPTPRSAASSWATPTCRGCSSATTRPPHESLRRYLKRELKTRVSVLNTGVMGYSPEQYYHSLPASADRFRPHFVVVSILTNDFGDLHEVPTKGRGDWGEGKYRLDKIVDYCRFCRLPHIIVPVPHAPSMFSKRRSGFYP